ncbi:hypothetical protein Hanom_Chr10g00903521 [Helianthus anomalus]
MLQKFIKHIKGNILLSSLYFFSNNMTQIEHYYSILNSMQLISVIYRLDWSYRSLSKLSVSNIGQNIGTDIIGDIDQYNQYITNLTNNRYITNI